jgi:DnaJ-class molecular chaperone
MASELPEVERMQPRSFYVALGVPRGTEGESIQVAYRKMVIRYRRALEPETNWEDDPTQPPVGFGVLRPYSERRHGAIFEEPEPLIPPQKAMVDRFFGGFVPEVVPPARARPAGEGKDLYVELRLSRDEARTGGIFPVHIPVVRGCPSCEGASGEAEVLSCPLCGGSRQVTEDRMVEVTAPPGVRPGHTARVAMEDIGLRQTDLIILVLVS